MNVLSDDASIQQGVDIAATGGTVNVGNGSYSENVALRKSITLIGENNVNTYVDGTFRTVGNPGNITIAGGGPAVTPAQRLPEVVT